MSENKFSSYRSYNNKSTNYHKRTISTNLSSGSESLESGDTCSSKTNSSQSIKYLPLKSKKTSDLCYTLDLMEKYGNIYTTIPEGSELKKLYLARIHLVNFQPNQEIFDKGEQYLGNYFEEGQNVPEIKFWYQRYYYYKKFDEGIRMDLECWWSVTPEEIAIYTADLIKGKTVIDGFCGSGGNVIQVNL
jgi:hypothetical protein